MLVWDVMKIMLVHFSRCERNNAVCVVLRAKVWGQILRVWWRTVPLIVYCIECRFSDRTRDIHPGGSLGSDGFWLLSWTLIRGQMRFGFPVHLVRYHWNVLHGLYSVFCLWFEKNVYCFWHIVLTAILLLQNHVLRFLFQAITALDVGWVIEIICIKHVQQYVKQGGGGM